MAGTDVDVAVVWAGPTGLLLAGDLAAAGVACTVVGGAEVVGVRQDADGVTSRYAAATAAFGHGGPLGRSAPTASAAPCARPSAWTSQGIRRCAR
jgi:hypothetical protein